jgi:hypothetical protein
VFKAAPVIPIEVEAALVPPTIRLNTNSRRYAFRILKLGLKHLIRQEVVKLATLTIDDSTIDDLDNSSKEDDTLNPRIPTIDIVNSSKPSKTIQLEQIRNSISRLYNLHEPKKIQYYYFKP